MNTPRQPVIISSSPTIKSEEKPHTSTRCRSLTPAEEAPECEICYRQFAAERRPLACHGCKKRFCKPCLTDWVKHQPGLSKQEHFTDYTCPNCRRRMCPQMLITLGVRLPSLGGSSAYLPRSNIGRDHHSTSRPRARGPPPRARIRSQHSARIGASQPPQSPYGHAYYTYAPNPPNSHYMMPSVGWPGLAAYPTVHPNNAGAGLQSTYPMHGYSLPPYYAPHMVPAFMYTVGSPQYQTAPTQEPDDEMIPSFARTPHDDLFRDEPTTLSPARHCPAMVQRDNSTTLTSATQQSQMGFYYGFSMPPICTFPTPGPLPQQQAPMPVPQLQWHTMNLPPPAGIVSTPVYPNQPHSDRSRTHSRIYGHAATVAARAHNEEGRNGGAGSYA